MKKNILALIFIAVAVVGFSQGFDDMAYFNPEMMTYFQQEMSSLMRFQFENDINIPFFLSGSYHDLLLFYKSKYLNYLNSDWIDGSGGDYIHHTKDNWGFNILGGVQIRLNRALYLPILGGFSLARFSSAIDGEWTYIEGKKVPVVMKGDNQGMFFGGGLGINTDFLKGGIYLGWGMTGWGNEGDMNSGFYDNYSHGSSGLRIALVPLVNTSSWKYVGMVLNYLLGFFDMGNVVMMVEEDKGDSRIETFVNTFNAGLDFAFSRMHFGPLTLQARAIYTRNAFDTAARSNVYGLNVQGVFSAPFGFTLEGGYKQFFALPQYYEREYGKGTGYFNGSIFFPFKKITFGAIYGYDKIHKSKITFALSTNFLSSFFALTPASQYANDMYFGGYNFDAGLRFRWGGWKAKPREEASVKAEEPSKENVNVTDL